MARTGQWYLATFAVVIAASVAALVSLAFSPMLGIVTLLALLGALLLAATIAALRRGERDLERIIDEELHRTDPRTPG